MAEPTNNQELLTWQQKLQQGQPLNTLEETKADADFNYKQRLREHRERLAFEARKAQGRTVADIPVVPAAPLTEKKGE